MRAVECCIKRAVPNRSAHGYLEPVLMFFWNQILNSQRESERERDRERKLRLNYSNVRDLRVKLSQNRSRRSLSISFFLVWLFYSVRSHTSSTQFKVVVFQSFFRSQRNAIYLKRTVAHTLSFRRTSSFEPFVSESLITDFATLN